MKQGKTIVVLLSLAGSCLADGLMQQYEKAYYLETAKGKVKEATAMYRSISDTEATDDNREAIRKSLFRLLHIGTVRKHEPTIKDCHEKLLTRTDTGIQELIDAAREGATIYIPAGTHEGHIVINKKIILQGADRKTTFLQVTSDKPLIEVPKKQQVLIQSLTLQNRVESSERSTPPGCAVFVKDAKATLKDCAVVASGSTKRCPLGVYIQGFSNVELLESRFQGYAYPIFYCAETEGTVRGCIVSNPGDCGFISHAGSEVWIEESIFTGSSKHGVRSTGGTVHLKNNLIVGNRNRGIYLGNKTTHGDIINNAIVNNGSGISVFASSDVEIENNVILNNGFSGIDTRCSGRIRVKNNILAGNKKTGFAVFEEGKKTFRFGSNTLWNNGRPSTDFKLPASTVEEDPGFKDAGHGNFAPLSKAVASAGHGLTDAPVIEKLWSIYKKTCK